MEHYHKQDIAYVSQKEIDKLFQVTKKPRDKAIVTLMYYCGLRASEVGLLKLSGLRLKDNRLFVHRVKGSLSGDHVLAPAEVRVLRAWLAIRETKKMMKKNAELLFPSSRGLPISRNTIYKLIRKYGDRAGWSLGLCHPHTLKHSIATHMIEADIGIEEVQDWLGHRDIRNTAVYAKVTDMRKKKVANRFYEKRG